MSSRRPNLPGHGNVVPNCTWAIVIISRPSEGFATGTFISPIPTIGSGSAPACGTAAVAASATRRAPAIRGFVLSAAASRASRGTSWAWSARFDGAATRIATMANARPRCFLRGFMISLSSPFRCPPTPTSGRGAGTAPLGESAGSDRSNAEWVGGSASRQMWVRKRGSRSKSGSRGLRPGRVEEGRGHEEGRLYPSRDGRSPTRWGRRGREHERRGDRRAGPASVEGPELGERTVGSVVVLGPVHGGTRRRTVRRPLGRRSHVAHGGHGAHGRATRSAGARQDGFAHGESQGYGTEQAGKRAEVTDHLGE